MTAIELTTDAELVAACLSGDREAFGRIVEKYQRLLCSLAYSATGSLSESEDLAQEAFLDAWRQLGTLREPAKLRPWLCGILRHKISRLRRSDTHEPTRQAEDLDQAEELPSLDEAAADLAMNKEEQLILWSVLERVPNIYREPLVLFYRENRSIEHVAEALDLTEDAVKQRLARGRRILQERVLTFVGGALSRTTPGRAFTLGVIAALPPLVTPANAAGVGAVAAHGSLMAKSTGLAAVLSSISGIVSAVITLRTCLDQSRTPLERRFVIKSTAGFFFGAFGYLGVLYLIRTAALPWPDQSAFWAGIAFAMVLAFVVVWPVALQRIMRYGRELRTAERQRHPSLFSDPRDRIASSASEYCSRIRLLGVPLVRIRYSTPEANDPPVFGWFAGGDRAIGLLCAWGGYAVAPFSMGAVAIGIVAIGSLSVGVISFGTIAAGLLAVGCASVGIKAFAWLAAFGWKTAAGGGFAVAGFAAEGPIAIARHANNPLSAQMLSEPNPEPTQKILLIVLAILSLIPVILYARAVRKRLGSADSR